MKSIFIFAIAIFLAGCAPKKSTIQNKTENNREFIQKEKSVYNKMISLKNKYPEGMKWTNDKHYQWKGGIYSGGNGCAAFAFLLSDAAFNDLPARRHTNFNNVRVGDIIRINNDTHYVIVLEIDDTGITIAEGNFNSSVHWGRKLTIPELKKVGDYILTRYPE